MLLYILFFQVFSIQNLESNQYNGFYFEDSNKKLWLSSPTAWNCIDTFETKIYRTPQNYIQSSIFEDEKGNLYSTSQNRLLIKSKKDESFNYIQLEYQGNLLQENYHISYIDTLNNSLLFSADNTLFWISYQTLEVKEIISKTDSRRFFFNPQRQLIIGCPWILGFGFEVLSKQNGLWTKEYFNGIEYDFHVSQVLFEESLVYLATDIGLVQFDLNSKKIEALSNKNECSKIKYFIRHNSTIISLYRNCGLEFYDLSTNTIIENNEIESLNKSLKLSSAMELFVDSKNFLYISTPGESVQRIDLNALMLSNTEINREIFQISSGNDEIVLFTKRGEIIFFDRHNKELDRFNIGSYNDKIIDVEKTDSIFFIATLKAIYKFDIKQKEISKTNFESNEAILNIEVNENDIIVGTVNSLYQLSETGARDIVKEYSKFGVDGITGFVCGSNSCVIQDGNNKGYYYTKDTLFQLDANIVFDVELVKNQYHIETSEGLLILEMDGMPKGVFKEFDSDILGVHTKGDTSLIITQNELYFIIENNVTKYPYELDHTFISQTPVRYNDSFIVAHKNGYVVIPDKIWEDFDDMPNIQLKYNSSVVFDNLEVEYNDRDIKMLVECSDLYNANEVRIQYSLDNFVFSNSVSSGEIELNNLTSGKHDLSIKAVGSNNKVKEEQLTITVLPPYYQTWWFRTLCIFGFIGIGFAISYYRTRQKLKKQQIQLDRQEALQQQRNRMSQDLHDEMGSGLSAIKHLSATQSSADKDAQIESIATTLIRSMRDLLWSLDESNDTVHNLSVKIRQTANQMLRNSTIKHTVKVSLYDEESNLPGPVRRNLILVMKEIFTNALKHSKATTLDVIIATEQHELTIDVIDNGIGYDIQSVSKGYGIKSIQKRVHDIGATTSTTSNNKGTHIIIVLPLL